MTRTPNARLARSEALLPEGVRAGDPAAVRALDQRFSPRIPRRAERFGRWLLVDGVVALATLVVLKAVLLGSNLVGPEAVESPAGLIAKAVLFLGDDALGAVAVGLLTAALARPLLRWRAVGAAALVSAAVQAVHGGVAALSALTTLFIGAPLDKAALDVAFLEQPVMEGGANALSSSIAVYATPGALGALAAMMLLPALASWTLHRRRWHPRPRTSKALVAFLVATLLGTRGVLPFLINGEVAGIRLHTYGLERSAWVTLVGSVLRPTWRALTVHRAPIVDPFVFDLAARTDAGPLPNPLVAAVPQRTNVIYVSLESVGQTHLGGPESPMPFLDGIGRAKGGLRLQRHYATWPQTMKAYFSLLCSELPYPFYPSISYVNPAIPCRSLPEVLKDAGYRTAFLSSADLAYDRKLRFLRHRRFDRFEDMRSMPGCETAWRDSWGHDERCTVRRLLDWAGEQRGTPFFVFYEMSTAHHPYTSCLEHEQHPLSDERAAYRRALGFIDDRLKELVDGLAARRLLDTTLIVFVSDHAEGFGEHPGSRSHGPKVYDENVRVPFAMVGPQLASVSGSVDFTTSHLDVAPTILGLVGLAVPCTMKGRDLTTSREPRIAIFGGRPPGAQRGLVDGSWKYLVEEGPVDQLFDLDADPGETRNLAGEHADLVAAFRARIEGWEAFSENLIERYGEILARSACRP